MTHIYIEEAKQLDIEEKKPAEVIIGINITGLELPVTFSSSKTGCTKDSILDWKEHIFI